MEAQNESIRLPGSTLRTEDTITESDIVFVGIITKPGHLDDETTVPADGSYYSDVKVKILRLLRGLNFSHISVALHASDAEHEKSAQTRTLYLFFVRLDAPATDPETFTVLKLLPATEMNLATVKGLIAAP